MQKNLSDDERTSVTVFILLFAFSLSAHSASRGSIRRVFRSLPFLVTLYGPGANNTFLLL